MVARAPTLRKERGLLRAGARSVAGIDEVGRGALAGPVTVGVVVIDSGTPSAPRGVRDSKLLTPSARHRMVTSVRAWAVESAVGEASCDEIDTMGIVAALRQAALRALASLDVWPDVVLLDGRHDYLAPLAAPTQVVTQVRADVRCSTVAAASILAKTHRDGRMHQLAEHHPGYGWERNVGYGSVEHRDAIARLGITMHHRRSFRGVVVHNPH